MKITVEVEVPDSAARWSDTVGECFSCRYMHNNRCNLFMTHRKDSYSPTDECSEARKKASV